METAFSCGNICLVDNQLLRVIKIGRRSEMEKNIVVAVFKVESEGYEALSKLRQSVGGSQYFVSAAALVKKEETSCLYLDGFDTGLYTSNDAVTGGLIGMMLGILAGPLGVLLGGSYGALVGMTVDANDAVLGVSMLDQIADKLDDGMVALVALADEESPEELDAQLTAYDAVVARFDAEAVADEVDKAYEEQAEMARLAKKELRQEKSDQVKSDIRESVEQGRANFRYDMAFTRGTMKDLKEERKARRQEKREEKLEMLEENSELLKEGFAK